MKTSRLNLLRLILFLLSGPMVLLIGWGIDIINSELVFWSSVILLCLITIALVILFIHNYSTISPILKKLILAFIPFSLLLYFLLAYVINYKGVFYDYLIGGAGFYLIYSIVLGIICFYKYIGHILVGLIFTILVGFILNRIGAPEGGAIIQVSYLLSSLGFTYLIFKTIRDFKADKPTGRFFILFYGAIAVINIIFFLKFIESRPEFNSAYDIIGVIVFLFTCILLFIFLPFSNYIEWSKYLKQAFKRLIILPLLLFLLIFSLKFLLPESVYRKIFFKEYSETTKIYFEMKDYEVDFKSD